ncbi:MAG: hypothetical protein WAN48_14525 [Actinomycetes bacterium]
MVGASKWLLRRLRAYDPALADQLVRAHRQAVITGEVAALVRAAESVLDPVGGRLTEGFRA